jgi:hypothetical protein
MNENRLQSIITNIAEVGNLEVVLDEYIIQTESVLQQYVHHKKQNNKIIIERGLQDWKFMA